MRRSLARSHCRATVESSRSRRWADCITGTSARPPNPQTARLPRPGHITPRRHRRCGASLVLCAKWLRPARRRRSPTRTADHRLTISERRTGLLLSIEPHASSEPVTVSEFDETEFLVGPQSNVAYRLPLWTEDGDHVRDAARVPARTRYRDDSPCLTPLPTHGRRRGTPSRVCSSHCAKTGAEKNARRQPRHRLASHRRFD